MDTETTGLSLVDDIWEFAAIRREPDGSEDALHLFIQHSREKCERLPESFRADHNARFRDHLSVSPSQAICAIQDLVHVDAGPKPHVVGAVPNFDTERIAAMCRRLGQSVPFWHYHLIDVENLAVGYLAGRAAQQEFDAGWSAPSLPWDSDALSLAVGVEPPAQGSGRHTAMGDVEWAKAVYDRIMSDDAA